MKPNDLPQAATDVVKNDNESDASPAMLTAATLLMMTRFIESPSANAAEQVILHLEVVAEDERGDPLMREVCSALAQRWQGHASNLCPHQNQNPNSTVHH